MRHGPPGWAVDRDDGRNGRAGVPILNLNGQEQLSVQRHFIQQEERCRSRWRPRRKLSAVASVLGAAGNFILDAAGNGAVHADGTIVTAARRARETVVLYLTGATGPVATRRSLQPASLATLSMRSRFRRCPLAGSSRSSFGTTDSLASSSQCSDRRPASAVVI